MFTGIKRKIIISNLLGLPLIFIALLFIDSGRTSLTDLQIKSLLQQGKTIASILTERSAGRYDYKNNRLLRPIGKQGFYIREPLLPDYVDALLFDRRGNIIEDSRNHRPGKITVSMLPDIDSTQDRKTRYRIIYEKIFRLLHKSNVTNYLLFDDNQGAFGADFVEFQDALMGTPSSVIRIDSQGNTILSIAVPVRRLGKVLGVLKMSSSNQNIAVAVKREREVLIHLFLISFCISAIMSYLLARGIANPLIKLTRYIRLAEKSNFRLHLLKVVNLTSLNNRNDEIGILSQSFDILIKKLIHHFSDIENFAADVAHELKNPLTSLKSALDTMHYVHDADKKQKLLQVAQHDIMRIDRLIGDISNLSRIDAEMNREIYEEINLVSMLNDLVNHYKNGALSDNITIHLNTNTDSILFSGIAERLGRAFSNILENALSFTPKGGTIDVTLSTDTHTIMIIITDTGIGIPSESLDTIFNRFYSDRPNTQSFGNHSGLGLAIVKRIIETHQGTITASNRTDNKTGAVFTLCLPC
jgi:two-component system, OmpR family, sensor histidine kinase ChvG